MATTTQKFTTSTTGGEHSVPIAILAVNKIDAVIGSIIQLDGRKSFDPEGRPLTFKWSFTQVPIGSAVEVSGFLSLRPTGSAVSFIPDKIGLYVIRLIVNDGELDSAPVSVVVNIQISRVPVGEGLIPDAHFLWSYLSNFWQLVEDREIITTIWSSVIQLIGTETIKLWSNDYNKSLQTLQNTFQRRWLNYTTRTDLSGALQQRVIVGKTSDGNAGQSGVVGEDPGIGFTSIFAVPFGTIPPGETDFSSLEGNYGVKGRVICINDEGYTLSAVQTATDGITEFSLAIVDKEAIPDGIVGTTWRIPHLLHTPSLNLEEEGIRAGDVLVFNVTRNDTGLSAELRAQVVCVDRHRLGFEFTLEDLEVGGETIDSSLFQQLARDLKIVPPSTSDIEADAAADALITFIPTGINLAKRPFTQFRVTFKAKYVIHNSVLLASDDVVSVPALQEQVAEPPVVLRENLDYVVEPGKITFVDGLFTLTDPSPEDLWAENTVLDNSDAVEANFGRLVKLGRDDLTKKQTQAPYLSAVKGLVFAYTNGPTVSNIRLGLQILMGLPFTEQRGKILELNEEFTFSTSGMSLGRILIEDVDDKNQGLGFRRLYFYPTLVGVEVDPLTGEAYKVGNVVEAFRPLSKGIDVVDYIKDPDWWKTALSGLEILKYFTFKATLDQLIFNSNDAQFAIEFIQLIKPKYTNVIVTILNSLFEDIELEDIFSGEIGLKFYDNVWGLEATARTDDDNQQGCVLWNAGSRPFSSRTPQLLTDVVTFKVGAAVRASSVVGWDSDNIRPASSGDPPVEGDILVILKGQPGASASAPGLYEIKTVIDDNTLELLQEAEATDPTTFFPTPLDADLFEYGTGLKCCILRRALNPVTVGTDLETTVVNNVAESVLADFLVNEVSVGQHLVIETGANQGEYIITELPTPPVTYISSTQVALVNTDGTIPTFTALTGQNFRIIRPSMMSRNIVGSPDKTVYSAYNAGATRIELRVQDSGTGDGLDAFTPGMVGTIVSVSNSDVPGNDGDFMITGYLTSGAVITDSASVTSDAGVRESVFHLR